jgi:conjugal transfer pilus assembly protein TraF
MKHQHLTILLTFVVLNMPFLVIAQEQEKEEDPVAINGKILNKTSWHYYVDPKEVEKKEPEKVPLPAPPASPSKSTQSGKAPEPFSVAWFKANYEKIENYAIDHPDDPRAIRALAYVERVMLDKSELFAYKKMYHQSVDPNLQEGIRVPITGASKSMMIHRRSTDRKAAMTDILKKVAVIYFHDPSCQFCRQMVPVLNILKSAHPHAEIRVASTHENPVVNKLNPTIPVYQDTGLIELFNITIFPSVALFLPPNNVYVIAQGSVYFSELEKRMINVAFEEDILGDEWFDTINRDQKGLMSAKALRELPEDIADDPIKLINAVVDAMDPNHNPMNKKYDISYEDNQ